MNSEKRSSFNDWLIGGTLLLVLALTRSGHFGSSLQLPDATWAAFWLGGLFALRWRWSVIMLATAFCVDYFVVSNGVSSYCVTPAYPFLIPTYLALWATGRWAAESPTGQVHSMVRVGISLLNGVTFAFIISNVSFYLFAGYFQSMSAWHYANAVLRYWPSYLLHTAIYAGTALLIRYIVMSLRSSASTQSAS